MAMMTLLPTVVEFALVIAVFALEFDWRYVAVVSLMIVVYIAFTIRATEWRIGIRKTMNQFGQRCQCQGGRQPAELRDREVFRFRGARGQAL